MTTDTDKAAKLAKRLKQSLKRGRRHYDAQGFEIIELDDCSPSFWKDIITVLESQPPKQATDSQIEAVSALPRYGEQGYASEDRADSWIQVEQQTDGDFIKREDVLNLLRPKPTERQGGVDR